MQQAYRLWNNLLLQSVSAEKCMIFEHLVVAEHLKIITVLLHCFSALF